ncbi:MAG: hypothetical protein KDA37_03140, partial [Planctomycetales bacterium]|nr:hypothetical protein [Planctomycetales bacterium]
MLRARPDLEFVAQDQEHGDRYTVKDTVSLEYFLLRGREHFLLRALSSPKTVEELHEEYRQSHPGEELSLDEVRRFCVVLHECSLVSAEGAGQGRQLAERAAKKRPNRWLWLLSPLAIRLPGFDPTPLLSALRWWGSIAFSRVFAVLLAAAVLLVGLSLLRSVEELAADLAGLAHLADPRYAVAAALALVLVKSWHELGHALACQRFGGECHEVGVMLLALMPCLYCDASDAWAFRRRRQRAVVALGGVYFELVLATAALASWMVLAPGFPRVFVLYVAVIASVSSVLVNLNPLMRFDGYYLLSDAWGVANLQQQSRQALWAPLARWISGRNTPEQPLDAPRVLLVVYALASIAQMTMVIGTILWVSHRTLSELGFRFAADTLVAVTLGGVLVRCLVGVTQPLRGRRFEKHLAPALRLGLVLSVAALGLWAVASVPIEQTLWSPCRIESDRI